MRKEILRSDAAPKAIGPYSPAVATDALVFTSGQLGLNPDTGKLAAGVEAQTHQAMKNLGAVLAAKGMTYESIVKTTVFVTDLANFSIVNQAYGSYFTGDYPARSCVQVAALPMGGEVEIECVAVR